MKHSAKHIMLIKGGSPGASKNTAKMGLRCSFWPINKFSMMFLLKPAVHSLDFSLILRVSQDFSRKSDLVIILNSSFDALLVGYWFHVRISLILLIPSFSSFYCSLKKLSFLKFPADFLCFVCNHPHNFINFEFCSFVVSFFCAIFAFIFSFNATVWWTTWKYHFQN